MTAAGTVPPAKVLVLGAGVAGLQAIATARRLGAVVSAFDVRAGGARAGREPRRPFLEIDDGRQRGRAAATRRSSGEEAHRLEQELVARHVAESDIVITTALVPGRPRAGADHGGRGRADAGRLGDRRPGRRGRRQLRADRAGRERVRHGVTVLGPATRRRRCRGREHALRTQRHGTARRYLSPDGQLVIDDEDDDPRGVLITRDGAVVHGHARAVEALAGDHEST